MNLWIWKIRENLYLILAVVTTGLMTGTFFTSLGVTCSSEYECANKSSSKVEGIGTAEFSAQQKDGRKANITLQDALFTHEKGQNLLTLAQLKQSSATMQQNEYVR